VHNHYCKKQFRDIYIVQGKLEIIFEVKNVFVFGQWEPKMKEITPIFDKA
jgi:hypothetical protein